MQYTDSNTRTAGAVIHPEPATWMAFLYGELSTAQNQELEAHLGHCAACAAQVKEWRAGRSALDAWTLPARRPARTLFMPVLRWAAAAALVLGMGIVLGRQTSRNGTEIIA